MDQLRVGFALCGSFCTLSKALIQMRELKALGADIFPIMHIRQIRASARRPILLPKSKISAADPLSIR